MANNVNLPIKPSHVSTEMLILSGVLMALYVVLFVFVYVQLWMIWFYRHKRLSYQSVFLMTCLLFSALRIEVFSFYFNFSTVCSITHLSTVPHWVFFSLPSSIQYLMICLLFLYFHKLYLKLMSNTIGHGLYYRYKLLSRLFVVFSLFVFVSLSLVSSFLVTPTSFRMDVKPKQSVVHFVMARSVVSGFLFTAVACFLSWLIYRISKLRRNGTIPQGEGLTTGRSLVFALCISAIFISRALYNFIAVTSRGNISQDGQWISVSDQADYYVVDSVIFVSFVVDLFVWELLPTFVLTIMFRVPIRGRNAEELTYPVIGHHPTSSDTAINTASMATTMERSYFLASGRYDTSDSPWPSTQNAPGQVPVPGNPAGLQPPEDIFSPTRPLLRDTHDRYPRRPGPGPGPGLGQGMPPGYHGARRSSLPHHRIQPSLPPMAEVTGSSAN